MVKNHPLADGNKRSAAALFVTFLARNGVFPLTPPDTPGSRSSALAAITLMIVTSDPKDENLLISLLIRMITF